MKQEVEFIFAVTDYSSAILLDYDEWMAHERTDFGSDYLDDIGISLEPGIEPGIYQWKGVVEIIDYGDGDYEPEYTGKVKLLYVWPSIEKEIIG